MSRIKRRAAHITDTESHFNLLGVKSGKAKVTNTNTGQVTVKTIYKSPLGEFIKGVNRRFYVD